MQDLTLDEGIYIRSMGSRGSLGGFHELPTMLSKFSMQQEWII